MPQTVTNPMLYAAMKKAVALGIVPPSSGGEKEYLETFDKLKAVLQAALDAQQ